MVYKQQAGILEYILVVTSNSKYFLEQRVGVTARIIVLVGVDG